MFSDPLAAAGGGIIADGGARAAPALRKKRGDRWACEELVTPDD